MGAGAMGCGGFGIGCGWYAGGWGDKCWAGTRVGGADGLGMAGAIGGRLAAGALGAGYSPLSLRSP